MSLIAGPTPISDDFACDGGGDDGVAVGLVLGSETNSSSSSSIGRPDEDEDEESDEDEVQSSMSISMSMGSLEESLPIKRGLSKHYAGKSKSFGNLGQVASLTQMVKPENPFNKRRRTLMAFKLQQQNNKSSFYSHSSHISMPLLPLTEAHDDDDDEDEDDDEESTSSGNLNVYNSARNS